MIQPGLITLQPNLDFMDSFEPLQGKDAHMLLVTNPNIKVLINVCTSQAVLLY